MRHGLFGPARTHFFSPVALHPGQGYVQRNDLHRSFWSFPTSSLQARVARQLSRLHVWHTGGSAFFGEALTQGVLGRQQYGALIPCPHYHGAVPSPPVTVHRVGGERSFDQADDPVELRVGYGGGDVELGDVHVLGGGDIRGEVAGPQPEAGRIPEDLDSALERRRPALLVAFTELGVVHRPEPFGQVAVVRRTSALQGEDLQSRRGVDFDDHALAPLPRKGIVRVLHTDLLKLGEQLFRVRISAEHPAARRVGREGHLGEDAFDPARPPLVRDRERRVDADQGPPPLGTVALDRLRYLLCARHERVGYDAPPLVQHHQA